MANQRLKILMLIKPFWIYPKHRPKIDTIKELETFADVYYWHEDGHINDILNSLNITPDFIFHYDIAWNYGLAPNITGLNETSILKGCFVIDLHWKPEARIEYITNNKIDIIFSATKHPFLNVFPQFESKLRWLPWSINPDMMKDWGESKTIDYLLMGLVYVEQNELGKHQYPKKVPAKGRYAFRDSVFQQMRDEPGFVFHPHPGHRAKNVDHIIVNDLYAQELNRAKIFFTCGSRSEIGGVAVLKYFEAPACKTLLLAETNQDIEELGFIDGENFVACTEENLLEKARYYLKNEEERNRITENGHRFIHDNHTNAHRAKYIIDVIEKLQ